MKFFAVYLVQQTSRSLLRLSRMASSGHETSVCCDAAPLTAPFRYKQDKRAGFLLHDSSYQNVVESQKMHAISWLPIDAFTGYTQPALTVQTRLSDCIRIRFSRICRLCRNSLAHCTVTQCTCSTCMTAHATTSSSNASIASGTVSRRNSSRDCSHKHICVSESAR